MGGAKARSRWNCGSDHRGGRLMAKAPPRFVCAECAAVTSKWAGKCETCGAWNSITQEDTQAASVLAKGGAGRRIQFVGLGGTAEPPPRIASGIAELDRVLGG
eukprot:gene12396-16526_t